MRFGSMKWNLPCLPWDHHLPLLAMDRGKKGVRLCTEGIAWNIKIHDGGVSKERPLVKSHTFVSLSGKVKGKSTSTGSGITGPMGWTRKENVTTSCTFRRHIHNFEQLQNNFYAAPIHPKSDLDNLQQVWEWHTAFHPIIKWKTHFFDI